MNRLKDTFNKAALKEFIESILFAVIVCGITVIFIATPNTVRNTSMLPNFKDGQMVLTSSRIAHWLATTNIGSSLGFNYYRGEVITFHDKNANEDLIKRVIALPGESIKIEQGRVYINGQILNEGYLDSSLYTQAGSFLKEGDEIKIPDNHYFLMGDNRGVSKDSRDIKVGIVNVADILGKVLVRYWPLLEFSVFRPT